MYAAVLKTFRGERPLGETYWLWGVLPGLFFTAAYVVVQAFNVRLEVAGVATPIFYSLLAVHGVFICFVTVAVWNSSGRYTGSTVWKVLARIAVAVSVVSYLRAIVSLMPTTAPITAYELRQSVEPLNAGLPTMIDEVTELTRVSVKGTEIAYHYVIVGLAPTETDDDFPSLLRSATTESLCVESDIRLLLKRGATMRHEYTLGRGGSVIAEFVVSASDCSP